MTILLDWWRKHRAAVLAEIRRADLGYARPVNGGRRRPAEHCWQPGAELFCLTCQTECWQGFPCHCCVSR